MFYTYNKNKKLSPLKIYLPSRLTKAVTLAHTTCTTRGRSKHGGLGCTRKVNTIITPKIFSAVNYNFSYKHITILHARRQVLKFGRKNKFLVGKVFSFYYICKT